MIHSQTFHMLAENKNHMYHLHVWNWTHANQQTFVLTPHMHIDGIVWYCSNSSVLAMELPQTCAYIWSSSVKATQDDGLTKEVACHEG